MHMIFHQAIGIDFKTAHYLYIPLKCE